VETTSRQTAVAVFQDRSHAELAVAELLRHGFAPDQIGVVTPDAGPDMEVPPLPEATKAEEGAAAGAVGGGVLAGLLGAGLATVALPGVGPVIAAGILAGLVGGASGGVLGALIGLSVPEEEAKHHERAFHSGRTLVTVRAEGRYEEAADLLRRVQETPEAEEHRRVRSRLAGLSDEGGTTGTGSAVSPEP
jgi:hypothetical protein